MRVCALILNHGEEGHNSGLGGTSVVDHTHTCTHQGIFTNNRAVDFINKQLRASAGARDTGGADHNDLATFWGLAHPIL